MTSTFSNSYCFEITLCESLFRWMYVHCTVLYDQWSMFAWANCALRRSRLFSSMRKQDKQAILRSSGWEVGFSFLQPKPVDSSATSYANEYFLGIVRHIHVHFRSKPAAQHSRKESKTLKMYYHTICLSRAGILINRPANVQILPPGELHSCLDHVWELLQNGAINEIHPRWAAVSLPDHQYRLTVILRSLIIHLINKSLVSTIVKGDKTVVSSS